MGGDEKVDGEALPADRTRPRGVATEEKGAKRCLFPTDENLTIYPSRAPADRVLEVRAGWAARQRVKRGARVLVK